MHSIQSEKFARDVNEARRVAETSTPSNDTVGAAEAYHLVKRYFDDRMAKVGADGISKISMVSARLKASEFDYLDVEAELDGDLVAALDPTNEDGVHRVADIARSIADQSNIAQPVPTELASALIVQVRRALIEIADEERAFFLGLNPTASHRRFSRQSIPRITFGEVTDRLFRDELQALETRGRTQKKQKATLDFLCRHFGRETPVASLTEDDLIEFRDLLARSPANATKRFGPAVSLREIVEQNAKVLYPPMSTGTQKTYLEMAYRTFQWALSREHIRRNPVIKLTPRGKKVRRGERRDPYTLDELNRIFSTPIYTGCLDDERGFYKRGTQVPKRSRFWVPLIALFTGMRAEEILQLTPNHIRTSRNGTLYFALTPDMILKNDNSVREIPIHPTLIASGFLDFTDNKRGSPDHILFDDLPISADETRGALWTKRYATFSKRAGVKHGKNCFHSFRHTFKDAVRAQPIPEEQGDMLQGWGAREVSSSRNYGGGYKADQLAPYMALICYEGLDLSHILECPSADPSRPRSP